MTSDLEAATRAYRRADKALEERRSILADAIVAAFRSGERQVDIVKITGLTRERIRQILRAGGIEP